MRITGTPSARRPSGLACAVVFLALTSTASGQGRLNELAERAGIEILAPGQSGDRRESQASQNLPWNRLPAAEQARVQNILDKCAQYRRLPAVRYAVDPEVYLYLVEHPDVAVSTWRAMRISKVQLWQTAEFDYEGHAPDGSEGTAHVVYRDDSQCLLLCKGTYSNPLLPKPITAAALLWMRYEFRPMRDGQQQVHQQTDVFLSFPSAATRTVAMLASPVTNMMMDRNLYEISLYARMMSQAVIRDPEWVQQLASQLDGVLPQRREEIAALVRRPAGIPQVRATRPSSVMTARPIHHPTTLHMYRPNAAGRTPPATVPAIPVPQGQVALSPVPAVPATYQNSGIVRITTTDPARAALGGDIVKPPGQTVDPAVGTWKAHNPDRQRNTSVR